MYQLWSGFFGTLAGAIIGGLIAYFIARFQFKKQSDHFDEKEAKESINRDIQLLWRIYFDIRNDMVNNNIWEKYDFIKNQGSNIKGTPLEATLTEFIRDIMIDIKELAVLIDQKSSSLEGKNHEFVMLWGRINRQRLFLSNLLHEIQKYTLSDISSALKRNTEISNLFDKNRRI